MRLLAPRTLLTLAPCPLANSSSALEEFAPSPHHYQLQQALTAYTREGRGLYPLVCKAVGDILPTRLHCVVKYIRPSDGRYFYTTNPLSMGDGPHEAMRMVAGADMVKTVMAFVPLLLNNERARDVALWAIENAYELPENVNVRTQFTLEEVKRWVMAYSFELKLMFEEDVHTWGRALERCGITVDRETRSPMRPF